MVAGDEFIADSTTNDNHKTQTRQHHQSHVQTIVSYLQFRPRLLRPQTLQHQRPLDLVPFLLAELDGVVLFCVGGCVWMGRDNNGGMDVCVSADACHEEKAMSWHTTVNEWVKIDRYAYPMDCADECTSTHAYMPETHTLRRRMDTYIHTHICVYVKTNAHAHICVCQMDTRTTVWKSGMSLLPRYTPSQAMTTCCRLHARVYGCGTQKQTRRAD